MAKRFLFVVTAILAAACSSSDGDDLSSDPSAPVPTEDAGTPVATDTTNDDAGQYRAADASTTPTNDASGPGVNQGDAAGGTSSPDAQASTQKTFSGIYATYAELATVMAFPDPIGNVKAKISMVLRVQQQLEGEKALFKFRACHIEPENTTTLLELRIAPSLSKDTTEYEGTGTVVKAGDAYKVDVNPFAVVLGAKLKNLAKDPLPTKVEDTTLYDQDHDSNPGITLNLKTIIPQLNGDVYMALRVVSTLSGTTANYDSLDGLLSWKMETSMVKSTTIAISKLYPISPDSNAKKSFFRHRRITQAMDCAEIMAKKDDLFGL